MPEPVAESAAFESVWRPPLRWYEQPPSRPVRLSQRERREALAYWQARGVIDEQGEVAEEWRTVCGALCASEPRDGGNGS